MFETLFSRRITITTYTDAPFAGERLRYLCHCEQRGYKLGTLRSIACHQLHFVGQGLLQTEQRISRVQIETAAKRHSRSKAGRCDQSMSARQLSAYVGTVVRWMRFLDRYEHSGQREHSYVSEASAFAGFMLDQRGLSRITVRSYCYLINQFFCWLSERNVAFAAVDIDDVEQFLTGRHAGKNYSIDTINRRAKVLRYLFRFSAERQWCRSGIAEGITGFRSHPVENIPKGLQRQEVSELLATTTGCSPANRRDRAILLLLAVYGFRAGELCQLRLDDIDWKNGTLTVRCPKPGRTGVYPLADSVAEAVIAYLVEVRPHSLYREVFLTLNAPHRPLASSTVSTVVRTRLTRIGVTGRNRGSHVLRHSAAQHLLDRGMTMKTIGDYLGHRSAAATSVYAKVDLHALRQVAEVSLEGLQ